MKLTPYDRQAAVAYAHQWAYGRNPAFYNYDEIGGDCTNFASQCLYAGSSIMNFLPTYGWYYLDPNQKSPSWTGVPFLFNFLTRQQRSIGPVGEASVLEQMMPGDLVQLRFSGEQFQHTPVVVYADQPKTLNDIWVAAHSYDADNRPLSTYQFEEIRFVHITGVRRP